MCIRDSGRCDRGFGLNGQHLEGQPLGGGGADHGHQLSLGGEPSGVEAQAVQASPTAGRL